MGLGRNLWKNDSKTRKKVNKVGWSRSHARDASNLGAVRKALMGEFNGEG
jgi:hypothetical protein